MKDVRRLTAIAIAAIAMSCCVHALAQTSPSIRGVVVGTAFDLFGGAGYPVFPHNTYRFGYRPDVPQDSSHNSTPPAFGLNAILDGYYPNGDDWALPYMHIVYGEYGASPPTPLPPTDLYGHTTLYDLNLGTFATHGWPGVYENNIQTAGTTFPDGLTIAINSQQWGGFFGVIKGANGAMTLTGAPWASPGADFGTTPPGFFAPGTSTVNFVIFDLGGQAGGPAKSTPLSDGTHLVYNLNADPATIGDPQWVDTSDPVTNKPRGRLFLRRKDFGARFLYTFDGLPHDGSTNTVLQEGLWEIEAAEGTFASANGGPVAPSDIGKGVGTWGQPRRFFDGVRYNDITFRNLLFDQNTQPVAGAFAMKYLTYQFLPAGISVDRDFNICTGKLCITVSNNGDVDLSNVVLTDADIPGGTTNLGAIAQNSSAPPFCVTLPGLPTSQTSTATSHQFRIERTLDKTNSTGLVADGTLPAGETHPFSVTGTNLSVTKLDTCISICGTVYCDKDGNGAYTPGIGEGMNGIVVTLNGADINGKPVSQQTTTSGDGQYCFNNLPPGTYTVTETTAQDSQPGDAGTKIDTKNIGVGATIVGKSTYQNENFVQCSPPGSICGRLYCDANSDGKYNPADGDVALASATVTLTDAFNHTFTQTTDANGQYCFNGLLPGSYTLTVPSPFGGVTAAQTSFSVVVVSNQATTQDAIYTGCGGPPNGGGGGPTRTWGFWKTHLTAFTAAEATCGINLGTFTIIPAQNGLNHNTTETPTYTLAYLEGVFWTDPGKNTTALGQARLQLAHQLIAAMVNQCYLGTTPTSPTLIADALTALDGTDVAAILSFVDPLDNFNTSGDGLSFPTGKSEGKADPNGSKKTATLPIPGLAFK